MRRDVGFCIPWVSLWLCACAPPPELGDGEQGARVDAARLDRKVADGPCGFPSPGEAGYGVEVGHRIANNAKSEVALVDCESEPLELADFFCARDDDYGDFNRGVFINVGAGWCSPCQEETLEFPALYEEYHARGIEFVQVLFQDWNAQAPTEQFCSDWREGRWITAAGGDFDAQTHLPFPIVMDQRFGWTGVYLGDPSAATPMNLLIDANGNIRWKLAGSKPDPETLRAQFELVIQEPYAPPQ